MGIDREDLLFAVANLARHLKVDAEQALRRARIVAEFADAIIADATLALCQAELERRR